jgi:hypothetical protein
MYRFLSRLLLIPIFGVLLQGCSAIRLGYGNADSLARWWIDQYVDLSPEQDVLVRERLLRFHTWHRKTQLPEYAEVLRQGRTFATGQPTAKDALALSEDIIRRGRTLADQAAPDIADFLASVGPAQIERMNARFAEKNVDFAKEAKLGENEAAQRKVRYKRLLERSEYWFGDFSDAQETSLRQLVEGQSAGSQFWYEERLRRQREWLDLVRKVHSERPPRERTIQFLRDYAAHFDLPGDPARLAQALAMRRASAELAVAIHALTTQEQRAHAKQKLDDLIRDFTELSQEN